MNLRCSATARHRGRYSVPLMPIMLLVLTWASARAQPFPTFVLDTSHFICPSVGSPTLPRVAFGDTIGLVIWPGEGLSGCRLTHSGAPMDTVPLDLDSGDYSEYGTACPDVAWSGRDFFVAWISSRGAPLSVAAEIVGTDGAIVRRIRVFDSLDILNPRLAVGFDGTNYLVAWMDDLADTLLIRFARVTRQGELLDSVPIRLAPARPGQYSIDLACGDGRYMAVWQTLNSGNYEVYGSIVLPDGSVRDSAGFPIRQGVSSSEPVVTHDGRNFIVAWHEGEDAKAARVTSDGVVLDTAGVVVGHDQWQLIDLDASRETVLVVWTNSMAANESVSVRARRLDSQLGYLDTGELVLSEVVSTAEGEHDPGYVRVSAMDTEFLSTWLHPTRTDSADYAANVMCRRVTRSGRLPDSTATVVSYGENDQSYPDVASDGTDFLAVWTDTRSESGYVRQTTWAARFTQDGTVLDPNGFRISSRHATRPMVAFGGGYYLVCWRTYHGIDAVRVTPEGAVVDSVPIRVSDVGSRPDVVFGDSLFLVMWYTSSEVRGARVTPQGVVLDTASLLLQPDLHDDSRYPHAAFDGDNFLVARQVRVTRPYKYCAARVSQSGICLDSVDIVVGLAQHSTADARPDYGGGVYLFADGSGGQACWRISPLGYVMDSFALPIDDGARRQVAYDGANFLVVARSDSLPGWLTAVGVSPNGRVLDSIPFALAYGDSCTLSSLSCALARNESNRMGLVTVANRTGSPQSKIRGAVFPQVTGMSSPPATVGAPRFRVLSNPVVRTARLSLTATRTGQVAVDLLDVTGRRCGVLLHQQMAAGTHEIPLDLSGFSSGVYFLRLRTADQTRLTRVVLVR